MDYKHKCLLEVDERVHAREHRSKIINVSSRNPRTRFFFRSVGSMQDEQRRHATSYYYIIHPLSVFRYYWEAVYAAIIYISLIIIPINMCRPVVQRNFFRPIELIFDFLCIIDIVVSFLTGICIPSISEVVTQPKKIRSMRLRSIHFYVDCLSSVPDDLLAYNFCDEFSKHNSLMFDVAISLLPLLKVMRSFKFLRYYHNTTIHPDNVYFPLLLKYFLVFILVFHWLTSSYIYCVMFDYIFHPYREQFIFTFEGIQVLGSGDIGMYINSGYIVASYLFALNLLCTFRKTISYTFHQNCHVLMFISISIFGFIFCNVFTVFMLQVTADINDSRRKYHQIVEEVKQYSASRNLPSTIRDRMLTYYEYRFRKMYFQEDEILQMLSDSLRKDIFLHSCRTLIKNVTILKDLPQDIISDVVSSLHYEVYLYNDIIAKAGTVGDCMYFIANGTVAVSTLTGREVCHLQDGAFFGEIALISEDHKRMATVVAIEICEIYRLDRKDFRLCFNINSAYYKKINQIANERIHKTALLEELHRKYIIDKTRRKRLSTSS